jgi:uncharacterized protein (DUF1330 family)
MTTAFLLVRSAASQRRFGEFCRAASTTAGDVLAAQPSQRLRCLEAGSRVRHCWIARYPDAEAARAAFALLDTAVLSVPDAPEVLLAPGVPAAASPETAHLPPRPDGYGAEAQPPELMLIEGDATDAEAMGRYRDIIMPLLESLGGYYHVYTPGHAVEVLSGHWERGFLALSRWPGAHAADAFWLGGTYQGAAIPERVGAGRFDVVAFTGERDEVP